MITYIVVFIIDHLSVVDFDEVSSHNVVVLEDFQEQKFALNFVEMH